MHVPAPPDPVGPSDRQLAQVVQALPAGHLSREAALEALVTRHRHIVWSCVQRYANSPEPREDLTQVGYLGLLKAIANFDPGIGELAAYAQVCVSGEIKRYFRDKRWQVRPGRPAQDLRAEVRAATADLAQQLCRTPRPSDLARHMHISEAEVLEGQHADTLLQPSSLDAPLPGAEAGTRSLADVMGDDDPAIDQAIDMEAVRTHWAQLPRREQRALMLRFYGNMTQAEIATRLGISQMHVSRLQARALAYLRGQLTAGG